MPRSPLPEREQAICLRLRVWREQRGLTRKHFADMLGLRPDSYSAYEYLRAPLRYELAQKIFGWFNLNPKWLATGEGPLNLGFPTPSAEKLGVSPRELFSAVYDRLLAPQVEERIAEAIEKLSFAPLVLNGSVEPPHTTQQRVLLEEGLQQFLRECFLEFSAQDTAEFAEQIVILASEISCHSPVVDKTDIQARRVEMDVTREFIARRRRELGFSPPE